jgi:hypothetical protein
MVQIIINTLQVIGDIIALVAAILAVIAFAIRHYIKEKISAAFKAKVEQANEQYKHGLAQEIEAYRASLLTTLEEHKLAIDIRRSIALEFAKQRMTAFQAICRDFTSILVDIYSWVKTPPEVREEKNAFLVKMLARAGEANIRAREYSYFIDPVEIGLPLSKAYRDIVYIFPDHMEDEPYITKVIDSFSVLMVKMRGNIIETSHLAAIAQRD